MDSPEKAVFIDQASKWRGPIWAPVENRRIQMQLFHFQSEVYHFFIPSKNFNEALSRFAKGLSNIYGETLQDLRSEHEVETVKVFWQCEEDKELREDTFRVKVLPENTAMCISANEEAPTLLIPE
jgi:hypothetical protein